MALLMQWLPGMRWTSSANHTPKKLYALKNYAKSSWPAESCWQWLKGMVSSHGVVERWHHSLRSFLSERWRKISSMSWCTQRPRDKKARRVEASISFGRLSAIWAAECTHLTVTPSRNQSRITRASSMALHSLHWGTEVFWKKIIERFTINHCKSLRKGC